MTQATLHLHLLKRRWKRFQDSIWFYPIVLSSAALGLFGVTTLIDARGTMEPVLEQLPEWAALFVFAGDASSAQGLLSVIAGMWATIIGISFSVTLVTVQLTATKYIAQVMPLFERDKVNQVVFGTYLATVIYALLVLRTVRTSEPEFVPYVGVNVAVVLAIVALFLLIAFISNVVLFVSPDSFIQDITDEILRSIRAGVTPETRDWITAAPVEAMPAEPPAGAIAIRAPRTGVLTNIYWAALCDSIHEEFRRSESRAQTGLLYLYPRIGDWVREGDTLAHMVLSRGGAHLAAWVVEAHEIDQERTYEQDPDYAVEALAGMTIKGAMQGDLDVAFRGVDHMFVLLRELATVPPPSPVVRLHVANHSLLIRRDATDLLAKLVRELTLISEVALAPSLPIRPLTEGISSRFRASLIALAREREWDAFFRTLREVRAWYESSFFHMGWVNGMRHLATDLTELAIAVHPLDRPAAFDAVLEVMIDLRDRLEPDSQAREALAEAFSRIAREVDLPLLPPTFWPERAPADGKLP